MPRGWRAWGLAAALLTAAVVLRALLDPVLGVRYPFGTIYLLVGIVGWFLGVAPATVVAIVGYVVCDALFLEPRGLLLTTLTRDWVEFVFFVAICAGGILGTRRIHQREWSLRRALLEQTATRAALHQSEHRFREVLDSMSDIVFTLRPDGTREYINPRWREFTGQQDADSKHFESLLPPQDARALRRARERALATGEPSRSEFQMQGQDGRPRWFVSRTVPIRDSRGAITGWVGIVTDVDDTRRARDELEASERRYRSVSESFDFGMWSADASGRVTFASPRLLQYLGKTLEEWADGRWHDLLLDPADKVAEAVARWRRCKASGEDFEWQFDVRGQDGSVRTIWSRGVAQRSADGTIGSWAGFNLDVSARRAAELAHARAREELELVTGLMTTGVVRGSRDHRFVWANRAYLRWIDRDIDQLRGLPIAAVVGEAGFVRLKPHLERVLAGESFDYEEPLDLPKVGRRWIHAAYTPVLGRDGVAEGWVAVVNDVTHRHGLEDELRDASRRKDEFIATLAHELRNPLAPIRYATQLFRPGAPAAQMADARRMIDRQLAHMSRLLDDLLDVSRVTRGALELRRDVLDLRTLIETAVEAAQPLAAAAGHGIDLRLPQVPLPVDGDATRLVQVIGNLLSNAVRFTPAGGRIHVDAALEACDGSTSGIVVKVRDNGIGIDAGLLPRIFEPFVQGERSSGPSGGLGIGLSLARQLALLHGGSLEASSAGAGQGSEFTLRLPRAADDPAPACILAAPDRVTALGAHARRLLVVDDNIDAADSLAQMLRLAGFETRVAYDGRTALEIAELMHPDVALLDLGLPLLSGYDVARRLRDEPWGRDLRLIAVTGWGQEGDRARSRDAGFDEHLTKPVDPEVLIEAILHEATPAPAVSAAGG